MSLEPGRVIGHYRVGSKLGEGGMGMVHVAHDLRLERDVAIKVLPSEYAGDPSLRARFEREARAVAALDHPGIVTIHSVEHESGIHFITMEWVRGEDLHRILRSRTLAMDEILGIGQRLADAVAAAHEHGIVHRDLKPANVMITADGGVKVLDFGIAKLGASPVPGSPAPAHSTIAPTQTMPLTEAGVVLGTLAYMSPEQIAGEPVDARTDVFSLGVILHEMVTGKNPFQASSAAGTISAILRDMPPLAAELRPEVPPQLSHVIRRCLEKRPTDRFQTARDVSSELRLLASSSSIDVASPQDGQRAGRPLGRRSALWLGASILLVAAAVVTAWRAGVLPITRHPAGSWGGRAGQAPARQTLSIAVLPFADLSPAKDQEYFSDGLSEELLNVLSKNPKLKVTSRTSAFSFKGKSVDLKTIANRLRVTHVLEGSVRKAGPQLRITAQLIEVATDSHLWSRTYDRQMENIFAIQEDIAGAVAAALKVTLEGGTVHRSQQTIPEAYNAYLQGHYFYERRTKEAFEKAVDYYQQALRIDPNYARAWVGLSSAHSFQADWGQLPLSEGYSMARKEVEKALALDPDLAEAYTQLGWIKMTYDWDWSGADVAYKRAMELEPANASVIQSAAWLAGTLGRFDDAVRLCRRAIELDPLLIAAYNNLGTHAYDAGLLDESEAAFRKALALNPEYPGMHADLGKICLERSRPEEAILEMQKETQDWRRTYGLALAYHAAGRRREADSTQAEFMERYGDVGAFQAAEIYAYRGEADRAFEWLERAYRQRDGGLAEIKGDPLLRNIVHDPRYAGLLKKLKLPVD